MHSAADCKVEGGKFLNLLLEIEMPTHFEPNKNRFDKTELLTKMKTESALCAIR